ncbi:hypothetical protein KAI46_10005 [bacterium]|nr:hypothetical protein [bacterium]
MDNLNHENLSPPIQTETMAQLLLNQRHWREAIEIYQRLGQQNPQKKSDYQKKIIEIKNYFKPQTSPKETRKTQQTRQKISHLKKLLLTLENQ